jgi:energy-coupling factor transporter ATP-binding protein EcfA2
MAEITVRAIDSALAMEEIQKRLGDSALIISTQRIDGQIEITATDEEIVKAEKESKPLILDDIYRQDKFSSVLNRKVGEAEAGQYPKSSDELYSAVTNKIEKISEELSGLKLLIDNYSDSEAVEFGTIDKLRFIGFMPATIDIFDDLSNETEVVVAVRKLAKAFVNGKCKHFDESNIFLIAGEKGSGKSTFVNKFVSLQQDNDKETDYLSFSDQGKRKLLAAVKSLNLSQAPGNSPKRQAIIIDTSNQENDMNLLIVDLYKANPEAKISVIHTVPVGSSYERLKKDTKIKSSEKYYWAFTKLDTYDLSVAEISAMIELENRCMFFSGIDKVKDGAYYAKVDQIEAYSLKKIKEEIV